MRCMRLSQWGIIASVIMAMVVSVSGTVWAQGPGNALNFNAGADGYDYVAVADSVSLDCSTALTLEAWIKLSAYNDNAGIISKYWSYTGHLNKRSYNLMARGNVIEAALSSDGTYNPGSFTNIKGTTVLQLNTWYHVALVFQGGTFAGLYLNGRPEASTSTPINSLYVSDEPLRIGVDFDPATASRYFKGTIDEVRVWNAARSETQLRETMCHKLTGAGGGLVGYWRLDEGSGTSVADTSGSGNTGTLINMEEADWVTSGAPIGDASAFVYGTGTVSLAHGDGDEFTIVATSGSPAGLHVYRVDESPNVTTTPAGFMELDPLRYWGVFVVGGTSPTYTATYTYDGHAGIIDEASLLLAKRGNNADTTWIDSGATLDTVAHTLVVTDQTGTEFILGSSIEQFCTDIVLYVTKDVGNTTATLDWTKACDSGSIYQVHRSPDPQAARLPPEFATVTGETWSESMPTEDLVFYNVLPRSTNLVLDWTGESYATECDGNPCDRVDAGSNGFESDGFCPKREFDPYADDVANLAISGDPAEFRVKLTCTGCTGLADITSIELLLDLDDNGVFDGVAEILPLLEVDALDTDLSDGKLYYIDFPAFLAVDALGNVRWAMADGSGTLNYTFRASTASESASGPATVLSGLTLLNNGKELIEDLGIPVVIAGACGYDTDWPTALVFFEEAETLLAPPSPYNQYITPARHPEYLSALLASAMAETGYTLRHYQDLFQVPDTKLYRDVMLDWIAFADEQIARMDWLTEHAASLPELPWKLDFPKFCIFLDEGDAKGFTSSPFAGLRALQMSGGPIDAGNALSGLSAPMPLATSFGVPLYPLNAVMDAPAVEKKAPPKPVYVFGDNTDNYAEWDRSDAYLLRALFTSFRAAAMTYRLYESDDVLTNVTVADLDWIETALRPEDDAKAHAECDPEPCPPMNGFDDDGDGLVDDLGFAARVFEMFPGLGVYKADSANGYSLVTVAEDSSVIIDVLREGMRLVLLEEDNQMTAGVADDFADATMVYLPTLGQPPTFDDNTSYNGIDITTGNPCLDPDNCPDGLPDLAYSGSNSFPAGFCPCPVGVPPAECPAYAPPMDINGGMGDDITWWINEVIDFYNENSGETPLDPACYPQEWVYTVLAVDWGYQWQRAVLPAADPDHICFNFRDDIERLLDEYDIDPADLGPDVGAVLDFLECIEVRTFIEAPEDLRDYLPHSCTPPANYDDPACPEAGTYTFNGFFGDWDEPIDPIVADKFWTIEPFSTFNQNAQGILDPACDPVHLNTDSACIDINWVDANGNGEFDVFERILMANASTPQKWIDLNNDGQWNGWTDQEHKKVIYGGEYAEPGEGLYNGLYVYFKDPTFGGRLVGVTNEGLNNIVGAIAGVADGPLAYPSDNNQPVLPTPQVVGCSEPGANYCFQATATDADGDTVHYKLVVPSSWMDAAFPYVGHEVLIDGMTSGNYELAVPAGTTWGLILLAYDNVNNLNDAVGVYFEITQ